MDGHRIRRVGLRKGTVHFAVIENRLAGPEVLDRDIEVLVGDLGEVFNVYEAVATGETILVRVGDELRG